MDDSHKSGQDQVADSDADAGRSTRKRALSVAPMLDGLEERQLLSRAGANLQAAVIRNNQLANRSVRQGPAARAVAENVASVRAIRRQFRPAPTNAAPQVAVKIDERLGTSAIPQLGIANNHPIGRVMISGNRLGIGLKPPQIPTRVAPPAVPAAPTPIVTPVTPAATTPEAPVATTPAIPTTTAPMAAGGSMAAIGLPFTLDPGVGTFVPPAPSPLDDAIDAAFKKFGDDSMAIQDKSEVTPKLLATLRKDFEAIDKAATAPADAAKVKALQDSLKAVGTALPTPVQMAQIKVDVAAVILSRGVTDSALINQTVSDAEAIYKASNYTAEDMALLAADGRAITAALAAKAQSVAVADAPPIELPPFESGTVLDGLFFPLMITGLPDMPMHGPAVSGPAVSGPAMMAQPGFNPEAFMTTFTASPAGKLAGPGEPGLG